MASSIRNRTRMRASAMGAPSIPGLETGYLRRAPRDHELEPELGAVPFDPGPERYDDRRARKAAKRRQRLMGSVASESWAPARPGRGAASGGGPGFWAGRPPRGFRARAGADSAGPRPQ